MSIYLNKGKTYLKSTFVWGGLLDIPVQKLILQITLDNAQGASSIIPEFKYNKSKALAMNFDDAALCGLRVIEYFQNKTYTDGCGNALPFRAGIAVIGNYTYDAYIADPTLINHPQRGGLFYPELQAVINAGWDIENHSFTHDDADYLSGVQLTNARALQYNNYKMNAGVVPVNFLNYVKAFKDAGMLSCTTQGIDNAPADMPTPWDYSNKPKRLSQLLDNNYFFQIREFAVNDTSGRAWLPREQDGWNVWGCIDSLATYIDKGMQVVGTHSFDAGSNDETVFKSWVDFVKTSFSNDDLIFASMREIVEYEHIRKNATKTESIAGNVLEISLDYANLNENLSWHDISFLLNTGNIQSINCNDPRFNITYNNESKLINAKYRKTVW